MEVRQGHRQKAISNSPHDGYEQKRDGQIHGLDLLNATIVRFSN